MMNKEERKEYMRLWRIKNKDKRLSYEKMWRSKNKEKTKSYHKNRILKNPNHSKDKYEKDKEYHIKRYICLKDKINKYNNEYRKNHAGYNKQIRILNKEKYNVVRNVRVNYRRKNDPIFKLKSNLSSGLYNVLKKQNTSKTQKGIIAQSLGCSIDEFKKYLESRFTDGMTWDNWSLTGWHIDHILPSSSFDLTKEEEIKKCYHYSNLRPLWSIENIKKSNKIIKIQ